jgi:hypothetical protein
MNAVEEKVKAWLTPMLITGFGMMSWSLISEIRSDVKSLLSATAQMQIKIEMLEKRMDGVENIVYNQTFAILPKETKVPPPKQK